MSKIELNTKSVLVILASFNGKKYIRAQVESILNQEHSNFHLLVTDDGSSDGTLEILNDLQSTVSNDKMTVIKGPGLGLGNNFFSGLRYGDDWDFYSFSDQDDIWHPKKLTAAIEALSELQDSGRSQLYGSRSMVVDENLKPIAKTKSSKSKNTFGNSLTECFAAGHTMLFNKNLRDLACKIPLHKKILLHDWIIQQICLGANGEIVFDERCWTYYRQHDRNVLGHSNGLVNKLYRLKLVLNGEWASWIQSNIGLLKSISNDLSSENASLVSDAQKMFSSNIITRMATYFRIRVRRKSLIGNIMFFLAVLRG